MSGELQTRLNTILLSIVLGVAGFIAFQVWGMNSQLSAQSAMISAHSADITEVKTRLSTIEVEQGKLNIEIAKLSRP